MGRDEQARADAGVVEAREALAQPLWIGGDVQAAFGGNLLSALRHEGDLVRSQARGDGNHLVRAGHLEIEDGRHGRCETIDVHVLNVPSILAQMSIKTRWSRP